MRLALLFVLAVAAAAPARPAAAQDIQRDLRESREKLTAIQAERQRLQREMESLRTRVRDVSSELLNIEQQHEVSRSALLELEFQTQLLEDNVEDTRRRHLETSRRLERRTADLHQRLRAIYKRGPLHSLEVLLTARGFADLLKRYKYLHLVAVYDRMIVQDFERLERELAQQERELRESLGRLDALREEKAAEVAELERLEAERQLALEQFREQETAAAARLEQLEEEQKQLTGAIAALERRRREEEAKRAGPAERASISTRDLGTLPWPVEGSILYRFGPDRKPNGIVLKNQGIGIGAPVGTPVRAVESGVVEFAGAFPGYGSTVIISHGGGYRTLYLYLRDIAVQANEAIGANAVLGTVGGEESMEGAHIEFQVRVPVDGGIEPVDPLAWLRSRAGGT